MISRSILWAGIFSLIFVQPVAAQVTIITLDEKISKARDISDRALAEALVNRQLIGDVNRMLETLLARDEGKRRAAQYEPDARGAQAARDDATDQERIRRVNAAHALLTDDALQNVVPDQDLRDKIVNCSTALASVTGAPAATNYQQVETALGECSEGDVQTILNDLEVQRQQTLATYNQCRNTLLAMDNLDPALIPSDPTGLARGEVSQSTQGKLESLQKLNGLTGNALTCAQSLGQTFETLQKQENTAAAMAMIMNQVGTICMASGGNPYVCGGAFILAVLASLFSSGGGDGDGDGDSDGTGEKGDGSNIAGTGPRQSPPKDPTIRTGECNPEEEVCGNCRVVSGKTAMTCTIPNPNDANVVWSAVLDSKNIVNDDKELVAAKDLSRSQRVAYDLFGKLLEQDNNVSSNIKVTFAVCSTNDETRPVAGIVIREGQATDAWFVTTEKIDGGVALRFEGVSSPMPESGKLKALCTRR